ncbi:MAG: PadR family transcriptional regulator [Acidobacteriota bacterium]
MRIPKDPQPVDRFLPLSAADCHVLMALARQELYGYALLQAMSKDSAGAVGMDIGALYRALDRLLRNGLILQVEPRETVKSRGKPRRYYGLTALGHSTLEAELRRLEKFVELARAEGIRS